MLLGILSVFALLGTGTNLHRGIYLIVFALLAGLGACWIGLTALRRAKRSGSWRPRGAIFGMVFGVIGSLLSAGALILFSVFWPQFSQYSRCLGGANTLSAQQSCWTQFERSVHSNLAGFGAGS
jgi:hypothetical protein